MNVIEQVQAGLAHARAGRLFAAEEHLQEALSLSDHPDVAANLAAVFQLQGRPQEGAAVLRPYLRPGQPHPIGWNTLGVCLLDLGDLPAAADCFRRAYDPNSRSVLPLVHLHAALYNDRDLLGSRGALEAAARIDDHDPTVRFHLGTLWGLLAPQAAERHHAVLPPEADAWRSSWRFVLAQRDPETRFFGSTAATLRHAAALATLPGSVVELGVRFGTSARLLQDATGLSVHGFDTFSGLPQDWHTVPRGAYSTAGVVPDLGPMVHLHKGLFAQTLPAWVQEHRAPLRLLHVDCDLYESTAEALHLLAPLVSPGTVMLFDEYLMNPHWTEDEHKALVEVGRARGWSWRYAAFSLFSHQAVVVITGT